MERIKAAHAATAEEEEAVEAMEASHLPQSTATAAAAAAASAGGDGCGIVRQLQRLFVTLQTSSAHAIDTKDLTRSFGWDASDSFTQVGSSTRQAAAHSSSTRQAAAHSKQQQQHTAAAAAAHRCSRSTHLPLPFPASLSTMYRSYSACYSTL